MVSSFLARSFLIRSYLGFVVDVRGQELLALQMLPAALAESRQQTDLRVHLIVRTAEQLLIDRPRRLSALRAGGERRQVLYAEFARLEVSCNRPGCHGQGESWTVVHTARAEGATAGFIRPNVILVLLRRGNRVAHADIRADAAGEAQRGIMRYGSAKIRGAGHTVWQPNRPWAMKHVAGDHRKNTEHLSSLRDADRKPWPAPLPPAEMPTARASAWLARV